jgi:hypothetical protein
MVPRTYPSTLDTTTANRQMVAYSLPSISGLVRWVNYIPIKISTGPVSAANTFNSDGYIPIDFLSSTTGRTEWVDYIPVYIDTAATDSWQISSNGYIPYAVLGTAPSIADDYYKYVTLLLNTTSTNGAQNNTFLDSSTNNFSITRNGDTTQGSFNPYMPSGYWSGYFDGTGDYLSAASNAAFAFGTGDFTAEAWIFRTATPTYASICAVGFTVGGFGFVVGGTGDIYVARAGTGFDNTFTANVPANQWAHIAVSRSGTSIYCFVNGTQIGSAQSNTTNYAQGALTVGVDGNGSGTPYTGYISNFRLVKGTAVYTANFTPPTTPLTAITNTSLLCLQDNRFKDNSTNAFAITVNGDTRISKFAPFSPPASYSTPSYGGSGYFDGTGDYLTLASNAAFGLGTGNFTIEMWVYATANPANGPGTILDLRTGTTSTATTIRIDSALNVLFYDGPLTLEINVGTITLNTWTHIALVRASGSLKTYINGTLSNTTAVTSDLGSNQPCMIGNNQATGYAWNGYLSNLRIVKGTAVYTAAFTPPTAPLTAITNTSLLLNFTNAGIYDAATINDGQTVGNAQVSTTQAKWSPTSMAFDGAGDAIVLPRNAAYSFGGDFTIECWVYYSTSAIQALFDTRNTDSLSAYLLDITASDKLDFIYGASVRVTSATSIPKNQWAHVAVARSSGTIRLFINGALDANTASTSAAINAASFPSIGGGRSTVADSVTGYYLNGYIQDLRITNGYARYTANFTPPTAAFPTN